MMSTVSYVIYNKFIADEQKDRPMLSGYGDLF